MRSLEMTQQCFQSRAAGEATMRVTAHAIGDRVERTGQSRHGSIRVQDCILVVAAHWTGNA